MSPRPWSQVGAALRLRAHVLMAEDNGVNQFVARNMLKSLGCEFEIVPNGRRRWPRCSAAATTWS